MSVIWCDGCDRFIDLDYNSETIYVEEENIWLCEICQERVEQHPEMEEEK